jgi:hypothetical protein
VKWRARSETITIITLLLTASSESTREDSIARINSVLEQWLQHIHSQGKWCRELHGAAIVDGQLDARLQKLVEPLAIRGMVTVSNAVKFRDLDRYWLCRIGRSKK